VGSFLFLAIILVVVGSVSRCPSDPLRRVELYLRHVALMQKLRFFCFVWLNRAACVLAGGESKGASRGGGELGLGPCLSFLFEEAWPPLV